MKYKNKNGKIKIYHNNLNESQENEAEYKSQFQKVKYYMVSFLSSS